MLFTVTQAARAAQVSSSTIRTWAAEFAEDLSPGANPGHGRPREFSAEDLRIFQTIAALRENLVEYPEIHEQIAAGTRAKPAGAPEPGEEVEDEDEETRPSAAAAYTTALTAYEKRIGALELHNRELTERLLKSEMARTAAETELRLLKEAQKEAQAPKATEASKEPETPAAPEMAQAQATPEEAPPGTWRDRLANWIRGA